VKRRKWEKEVKAERGDGRWKMEDGRWEKGGSMTRAFLCDFAPLRLCVPFAFCIPTEYKE
jgi:hypothetical protein